MRNFQDNFETRKRSLISVFSFCMTVPLSHLREQKFKYCCQDSINPLCKCGYKVKTLVHLFF